MSPSVAFAQLVEHVQEQCRYFPWASELAQLTVWDRVWNPTPTDADGADPLRAESAGPRYVRSTPELFILLPDDHPGWRLSREFQVTLPRSTQRSLARRTRHPAYAGQDHNTCPAR